VSSPDCADVSKLAAVGAAWDTWTGFHLATDLTGAAKLTLEAGLDQSLCDDIRANVEELVATGRLNESVLDRAAGNALRFKFAGGLFDAPYTNASAARAAEVDSPAHR